MLMQWFRLCKASPRLRPALLALAAFLAASLTSVAAFLLHFNLSTTGSLQLLLVLLVALRFGFVQATVVSLTAVLGLNYLFTAPIFQFTVADPQNWVSLATFELTALLVSGLSSQVRVHAARAETQRIRAAKLYELSRAILLIDRRISTSEQLGDLLREFLQVESAQLYAIHESNPDPDSRPAHELPKADTRSARQVYLEGKDCDDFHSGLSERVLRLGATSIGGMRLCGWQIDPSLADAVASLAAIAFERANAIDRENRAEAERNAEQLRSAVLDALAHGYKTPLTAIMTASSGLLAVDHLSVTQRELVDIIEEEAYALNQLTTRLLQTAGLDRGDVRLRRSTIRIDELVRKVITTQDAATQERTRLHTPTKLDADYVDPMMIELALEQLVDNAAKYSDLERPIDITVSQARAETVIVVANTGAPIRTSDRTRIFERFYRGAQTAHGPSGTGLGLSIVRKAAEAHGGWVSVECSEGITRFIFVLHHLQEWKHG